MSVPAYNDVLSNLFSSAAQAVERTNRSLKGKEISLEEYRSMVLQHFYIITETYLKSLPDVAEYGALVTLRMYGARNRDDIARRIKSGLYPKVEQAYRGKTNSDQKL